MAFDYEGAIAAGYSPSEIADYLGKNKKFDVVGARKAGYDDFEIISHLSTPVITAPKAPQKEGFFPGLKEGVISAAQATARGVTAPFQSEEDIRSGYAAQKAAAEERNVAYTPFSAIPEAYEKEGLGAAASATYKASRDALSRSLPYMAPVVGGAFTGSRIGALTSPVTGPVGPIVGGIIGGIAGGIPQFAGTNIERRIEEKTPGPLVTSEVYQTAAGQAALDTAATMFTLGTGLVAKVVGRPIQNVTEQTLLKTAERSLTGTVARGAGRGAISEMPTEVAQQILERKQAGLDLTSEDAYREYGEVAAAAGVLGAGMGGVGNIVTRGQAKGKIAEQEQARDLELAAIAQERGRIANIAATAKASEQARLRAEEQALAAREAELRKPLTEQMELDLAPETTVEEVAAKRTAESPQGDLFTGMPEAPAEVLPALDESTIKSFGFKKNSLPYKALQSLENPEISMDQKMKRFDQIIENNQEKIKTKENEEAIDAFKRFMTEQKAKEALNATTRPELGQAPDRTSVPTSDERAGAPAAEGTTEDLFGAVGTTGTDVGQLAGRAEPSAAPLEEPKVLFNQEYIPSDEWLQSKIERAEENRDEYGVPMMIAQTGRFKGRPEVPVDVLAQIPGRRAEQKNVREPSLKYLRDYYEKHGEFPGAPFIEVDHTGQPWVNEGNHRIMVAKELGLQTLPVEVTYYAGGEQQPGLMNPKDVTVYNDMAELEKAQLAQVTPAKAPKTPAVPRMTAEERQQRLIQQRAEEEAARKAEREANLAAAKEEQGGFREAEVLPEAEREGLQAAKEFETAPDVNQAYEVAKDTAGAFIRQTFGGVENITPEDKVTLPQFLSALADIMYHIVRQGPRMKTEALAQARQELGANSKYITDFQLNKAYATAIKQLDEESKTAPAQQAQQTAQVEQPAASAQPRESGDDLTGDSLFRDLVSPRVQDARLNLGAALKKITPKLLSMYQLVDQFGMQMPALRNYSELNDKMTMTQQRLKNKSQALLSDWGNFAFTNPKQQKELGKLMVEATRSRIHPDEEIGSEANAHITKDMVDKYEELSNAYNALSPEAKQIYQRAKTLLQENYQLRRTIYNDMVRGAYAEDLAEATPDEVAKINARIEKTIQEHELMLNEIRGPYFPLMRFGEYLVIAESDELRELRDRLPDADRAERNKIIGLMRQMEQQDAHYQVHAFEKRSDQAREANRLKNQGLQIREAKSEEYMNSLRASSFASIDQLEKIFDREIDLDIDPKDMRQLRQAMIDSVLAGLPENSALQRQIKRRNIAGATENMLQAFSETMERDSFYLSRMGFMKPLSKALIDMRNESKNDMQLRDVYNNVRARMNMDVKYDNHPILSKLTGFSSIYHLGIAPSYLLQNMTQPFAITLPQLAGRYGAAKTSKAVISAWKEASKAVKGGRNGKFFSLKDTDLSNSFSGGELKMVQMLQDLGKLDIANNMDTEVYTKGMNPKMIKFWRVFNWSSHNIELVNRLTSALAAYKLEMGKTGSEAAATKAARDAVELTQLDYSDTNAAYFMKQGHMGGLNRIPMQFRKYQQGMIYLLARNFKNAWGGDKEAKNALFYLMGTQLLMAGVRGVPVVAPMLLLMGMFGDPDDPEGDVETQLRNALADSVGPDTARVFWKGLPAMLGVDSGSLGMGNLFAPFPMMRASDITNAATGKDAVTEFMFNLGGAPVSMASKIGDAFILGSEGDYQKALEKVLPKFMSSLVKAERLGSEGLTTRSGNVAIEADEFSAWDQAIKALGFSPMKEAEYYQAMYEKERISSAIDDRRNSIIKTVATARMNNEDVAEALQQVKEFNSEHPTRRITGESIKRSIAQRRKDKQERSQSGVRYTKRERDIKDVTRYAD